MRPAHRESDMVFVLIMLKVPITPEFFLAKMKLRETHKKNLPKFQFVIFLRALKINRK